MYLASTGMPCESYRRRLRPLLLCLCYGFRGANSLLRVLNLHECSGLNIFFSRNFFHSNLQEREPNLSLRARTDLEGTGGQRSSSTSSNSSSRSRGSAQQKEQQLHQKQRAVRCRILTRKQHTSTAPL